MDATMIRYIFFSTTVAVVIVGSAFLLHPFLRPGDAEQPSIPFSGVTADESGVIPSPLQAKTVDELIAEAKERSSHIKGLYMTADVANDQSPGAVRLRNSIIRLATSTEINGIVIDVKEVCGPDYDKENLSGLVRDLKANGIWTIARIVAFKDASQIYVHPEWYLTRGSPKAAGEDECAHKRHLRIRHPEGKISIPVFWQDRRGGFWLDPAHPGARQYLIDFSKEVIGLGFDEIQFDYIRFPSDGDVGHAIYPAWDGKAPKHAVMKSFFEFLSRELRVRKPDIILSADLFGYAAIRAGDVGIGQRLEDIGSSFDYISFMVYPSHYYHGFQLPDNPRRGLPAVMYSPHEARLHPDVTVRRSLLVARDYLDGIKHATSTRATGTVVSLFESEMISSGVRIRPWLEDFFHAEDRAALRPHGVEKVRLQIEAAESVEDHGWLLWNAANVYTEGALRREEGE